MGEETGAASFLDALGDAEARQLLASVSECPQSAKELATELDLSLPTVYRRLDMLLDCNLVCSRTFVSKNGTHYKVYEASFERATVELDDGGFHIAVEADGEVPERLGVDTSTD
jgi:predicted transcriptional regulator